MIIEAPFPAVVEMVQFPDPRLNDNVQLLDQVNLRRSMNNTVYTYVKTNDARLYNFVLWLKRTESVILVNLAKNYMDQKWRITYHDNTPIIGYLQTNPLNIEMQGFAAQYPKLERAVVNIQFEGIPQ